MHAFTVDRVRKRLSEEQLRVIRREVFGDTPGADVWLERYAPVRFEPLETDAATEAAWKGSDLRAQSLQLWRAANLDGQRAAMSVVPTPMAVHGSQGIEVISEGPFGSCSIWLDARHPFSRWVVKSDLGSRYGRNKVQMLAPVVLSAARAFAYGKAIAVRLRAAGVPVVEVTVRLD